MEGPLDCMDNGTGCPVCVLGVPTTNITWRKSTDIKFKGDFVLTHAGATQLIYFCCYLFIISSLWIYFTFHLRLASKRQKYATVLKVVDVSDIICFATLIFVYLYSAEIHNTGNVALTCVDLNLKQLRAVMVRSSLLMLHLVGVAFIRPFFLCSETWWTCLLVSALLFLTIVVPIATTLLLHSQPVAVPGLVRYTTQFTARFCLEDWRSPPTWHTLLIAIALSMLSTYFYGHLQSGKKPTSEIQPVERVVDIVETVGKNSDKSVRLISMSGDSVPMKPLKYIKQAHNDKDVLRARGRSRSRSDMGGDSSNSGTKQGLDPNKVGTMIKQAGETLLYQLEEPLVLASFLMQVLLLAFPLYLALVTIATLEGSATCLQSGLHLVLIIYMTMFSLVKFILWPISITLTT